ncbi:MAG: His/Gly/Thr/Pro-type tRNA ligase C-terminal domain-containing protein, partial [Bacteroidota bacterium]
SDDDGLVLPPQLAPIQVVIVPIYKTEEELTKISQVANQLFSELKTKGISVKFDDRDTHKPGWKFAEYELKGVPARIAIGPKDLEKGTVEIARRDTKEKSFHPLENAVAHIEHLLDEMQTSIFEKARSFRGENTFEVSSWDEFKEKVEEGFVYAHWDGTDETEERIKEETKATIRCIPLDQKKEEGTCIFTGKPSKGKVLFAKAY